MKSEIPIIPEEQILRLPEVKSRTGLSRSSIYAYIKVGRFPSAINLGPRCVGWLKSKIDSWVKDRIQESEKSLAVVSK